MIASQSTLSALVAAAGGLLLLGLCGCVVQAKDQSKPELDQQADQKMAEAKAILASVAANTLEARAKEEGGLAETKLGEVRGDANCSSLRDAWEQGSLARHSGSTDTVLNAMRKEVSETGTKYILKGPEVPKSEIKKQRGLSRVIDLYSIFEYHLAGGQKDLFGDDKDFFAQCVNAGVYDPLPYLTGSIRGRLAEGWWFARKQAPSLDLNQLIEQLAIGEDSPQYKKGALRLDFTPSKAFKNLKPRKPTAFDGMPFGQFKLAPTEVWGVTAGGAFEAVAPEVEINAATKITAVKGPGTLAEVGQKLKEMYRTQIALMHEITEDVVERVFETKTREVFAAANDWQKVKEILIQANDE